MQPHSRKTPPKQRRQTKPPRALNDGFKMLLGHGNDFNPNITDMLAHVVLSSIVLSTCRRRRRLIFFAAEGRHDPYRAGPMRPKRQPFPGFERRIVFGTKVETIKFFCFEK